jgi:hypothetical protein
MYTTSVFYSQICASLLPDRHSSSYGSHFLIRQCITLPASGRLCQARLKTEAGPAGLLGSLQRDWLMSRLELIAAV